MQDVIKFARVVGVADNIKFESLSRFEECVLYLRLKNGNFLAREGMELCLDFRVVDYCHFLKIVFQDLDLPEVQLLRGDCNFGPI